MKKVLWIVVAVGCVLLARPAPAQVPDVAPTDLRVTDVAVFKHGYGFVMAEGMAQTKGGWCVFSEVPQASLGTLWLYSPDDGVAVDRVIAEVRDAKQKRDAENLDDLIRANVGKLVTIRGQDDQKWRGTLLEPILAPGSARSESSDDTVIWAAVPPRDEVGEKQVSHVVLNVDGAQVAIRKELVQQIWFAEEPSREVEITLPEQALAARLIRGDQTVTGAARVGMGYMTNGLRWIPSYQVNITGDGQANLRLQGTVINDATDLQGSRLHLVVGVPHFIQENVVSPLSLQVAWTKLSSYFVGQPEISRGAFSNVMMTQMAGMPGMGGMGGAVAARARTEPRAEGPTAVMPVTGAGAEELFFYKVPDVTLKRGGRASVAILDAIVKYEDVYLLDIIDEPGTPYRRWSPRYQQEQGSRSADEEALAREMAKPKVWHALRIQNETEAPWTTAPALTVRDWQPIAQSMMLYTPIGGQVDLRTTIAPDILTDKAELEVGREPKARHVSGSDYDLLTISGEVTLTNHKAEQVRLIVTRQFEGEVIETSDDGQSSKLAEESMGINPTSSIVWDFELPAGEEKVLTYTYKVYVRV